MSRRHKFLNILSFSLIMGLVFTPFSPVIAATQIDIIGTEGSESFGTTVSVLPNGNIVICDPYYDDVATANVGAVYLYDGSSAEQISMLTGSSADDQICSGGVTVLTNGNYVVISPYWDYDTVIEIGAVTWVNGSTGITGTVSVDNSLVGSTAGDYIGYGGVTALTNGNYVVRSPLWNNGGVSWAGAVTWGNGTTGITGTVSTDNSLVGGTISDTTGSEGVTALANGNYLVGSQSWDNGLAEDAGAITWGDGMTGITGTISADNSLVGSTSEDRIGFHEFVMELANGNYIVRTPWWNNNGEAYAGAVTWGDGMSGVTGEVNSDNSLVGTIAGSYVGQEVTELTNGNYVVCSYYWSGVGAVTWGDGSIGVTGEVSAYNSLVGSTNYDYICLEGVTALSNGNYVVSSHAWDNGLEADAGAVTWGDGTTGITGTVSADNSLVGSTGGDYLGIQRVTALTNGNYVMSSTYWQISPGISVGAATWGDGTTGITGTVSSENSLVGSTQSDLVGEKVTALSNGNYIVSSRGWDSGSIGNIGAVTWGNGATGITGPVSVDNSLVGSTSNDQVGSGGVTALTNGNYVVSSLLWDNGGDADAGAVTWGDGTTGITGTVSADNSLIGSTSYDQVSLGGMTALDNGNYLVFSIVWDNGGIADAGAVTWGNGIGGTTGAISPSNSLVGSINDDQVGFGGATLLTNGNYVVVSPYWDDDAITDAGAVTWGDSTTGTTGEVSSVNSMIGSSIDDWVGEDGLMALPDGNYIVFSSHWDYGTIEDAGAISWGDVNIITIGPITYDNSVRGTATAGGSSLNFAYDDVNDQLVVGRPFENIVTLFRPNRLPVTDAGADQTIKSGTSIMLDGNNSYDPDGNLPLIFEWEQSSGTPVMLSGSNTATPSFTAPVVMQPIDLTFTLVVTDALGLPGLPDEVIITVEPYTALLPMVLNGE